MSNFIMTERDELLQIISDMNKDINGVRPSLAPFNSMSETELKAEIERLQPMVDEAVAHEQMIDAVCITRFNDEVATFIQQGAANRSTAIRWMLQAQGYDETPEDADFICYNNGINPFIPAGKEIFEEVEAAIEQLSN
jgi:glutaminase